MRGPRQTGRPDKEAMNQRDYERREEGQRLAREMGGGEAAERAARRVEEYRSKYGDLRAGVPEDDPRLQRRAFPSRYGWKSLDQWLEAGETEIYLIGRASDWVQNLNRVMRGAYRFATAKGIHVVHMFSEGNNVCGRTLRREHRPTLHRALQRARERGIPLVFVAPSRALRNQDYDSTFHPDLGPNVVELEAFMRLAEGVKLGTLNGPDSTPVEDEAFIRDNLVARYVTHKKPGPKAKGRSGDCKQRRVRWAGPARRLYQQGWSLGAIQQHIFEQDGSSVAKATLSGWCRTQESDCR